MVPTEILAIQHFNYFSNLFEDTKINIVLLSSKINSKKKESVKKKIEQKIDFKDFCSFKTD